MICFAVVAAIRPKPAGVSSYSSPRRCRPRRPRAPARVTCPFLRSSSTRAVSCAPGVLWYAVSSACSIASTSTSKEISFSRSSILRMLRSMSIRRPRSCRRLRLNSICTRALATSAYAGPAGGSVDVEGHRGLVTGGDAAGQRLALDGRDLDQPVGVAAPVARQRQRAVDPSGGHLEGVGHLAHHVGVVEHLGDRPRRVGDVVEGDPAVLVDGDPRAPVACRPASRPRPRRRGPCSAGVRRVPPRSGPGWRPVWRCSQCATSLCCCRSGPTIAARPRVVHRRRIGFRACPCPPAPSPAVRRSAWPSPGRSRARDSLAGCDPRPTLGRARPSRRRGPRAGRRRPAARHGPGGARPHGRPGPGHAGPPSGPRRRPPAARRRAREPPGRPRRGRRGGAGRHRLAPPCPVGAPWPSPGYAARRPASSATLREATGAAAERRLRPGAGQHVGRRHPAPDRARRRRSDDGPGRMSTLEALQATLAAEHAALYLYGLYGGRTSQSTDPALFEALAGRLPRAPRPPGPAAADDRRPRRASRSRPRRRTRSRPTWAARPRVRPGRAAHRAGLCARRTPRSWPTRPARSAAGRSRRSPRRPCSSCAWGPTRGVPRSARAGLRPPSRSRRPRSAPTREGPRPHRVGKSRDLPQPVRTRTRGLVSITRVPRHVG